MSCILKINMGACLDSYGDRSSVIYKPLASRELINVAVKDQGKLLARLYLDMHLAVVIVLRLPACKL